MMGGAPAAREPTASATHYVLKAANIADCGARRIRVTAALVLVFMILVRLECLFRFPLTPDETYYWEWSRHLSAGYYDQGPMIAWVIWLGRLIFGDSALGIRSGILVAWALTQLIVYFVAEELGGPRAGLVSLILSGITPLSLVGGFVATYDPLAALFWAGAVYCLVLVLVSNRPGYWYGAGICFGLGMLSKHTMALLALCVLVALIAVPQWRTWLRRPQPYLAFLLGLAVFAPDIWWQAGHGWMTFHHELVLAHKGSDQTVARRLGDFTASQIALMTPLLFAGLVWAMIAGLRERVSADGARLLFWCSAPVLAWFVLSTFKAKVQANWAVNGWILPPVLYALQLTTATTHLGFMTRARVRYAISAAALCTLITALAAWPGLRQLLHVTIPEAWDTQVNKMYGGPELGSAAGEQVALMQAETLERVAVGAATYDVTSRLAFYTPGRPAGWCLFLHTRPNSYLLWNSASQPAPGGNALIVDDYPPGSPKLPAFTSVFARVVPVPQPVLVYRRPYYTKPVHTYYLYRCYGYKPNPKVEVPEGG